MVLLPGVLGPPGNVPQERVGHVRDPERGGLMVRLPETDAVLHSLSQEPQIADKGISLFPPPPPCSSGPACQMPRYALQ